MAVKRARRSYTKAFRRRVVAETFEPGASVAAVARAHGINANMLFGWRKDARWMPRSATTPVGATFLPVEVAEPVREGSASIEPLGAPPLASPPPVTEQPATSSSAVTKLELTLRGGRTLSLEGTFRLGEIAALAREHEEA